MRLNHITACFFAILLGCGPSTQNFHLTGEFPLDFSITDHTVWLLTQTYEQDAEKSYGLALYSFDISGSTKSTRHSQTTIPEVAGAPEAMFSASITGATDENPGIVRGFGYFYKTGYQTTTWLPGQTAVQIETKGFKSEVAWMNENPLIRIDELGERLWFRQAFDSPAQLPLIDFQSGKLIATHVIARDCGEICETKSYVSKLDVESRYGSFDFFVDCAPTSRLIITNQFALLQPIEDGKSIGLSAEIKSLFSSPGRFFCGRDEDAPDGLWIKPNGQIYAISVSDSSLKLVTTIEPGPGMDSEGARTSFMASRLPGNRWLIGVAEITKSYETGDCTGWFASCAEPGKVYSYRIRVLELTFDGKTIREIEFN